jgi:hypothetical protein
MDLAKVANQARLTIANVWTVVSTGYAVTIRPESVIASHRPGVSQHPSMWIDTYTWPV